MTVQRLIQLPYSCRDRKLFRGTAARKLRSVILRHGFTLVEVVVAGAILIVLIVGISGIFARGVVGFKQAQLLTLGENLAEFQVEDLKNLAPSVLDWLVLGTYGDVNYPPARVPVIGDPAWVTQSHDFDQQQVDGQSWAYDSGRLQTDFMIDWVTHIGAFTAGTEVVPTLPSGILLGDNIAIEIYGVDPTDPTIRYWQDAGGWYYLSGATRVAATPPLHTTYYYRMVLQHYAYPLFSRQVRVVEYDVSTPASSDPWSPSLPSQYRTPALDTARKFQYEVTIWYKENGVDRVLYRTMGTLGSPFLSDNRARRTS